MPYLHWRGSVDGETASVGRGAFEKFERALIREWHREGIALAKQRGAYRGREKALVDDQVVELRRCGGAGEQKATAARKFGINRETLYQYRKVVPAPLPSFPFHCTSNPYL